MRLRDFATQGISIDRDERPGVDVGDRLVERAATVDRIEGNRPHIKDEELGDVQPRLLLRVGLLLFQHDDATTQLSGSTTVVETLVEVALMVAQQHPQQFVQRQRGQVTHRCLPRRARGR